MGYLLLSFFLIIFTLGDYYYDQTNIHQDQNEITVLTTQRAIESVRYIDAINDYIYEHPEVMNSEHEVILTDSQIGMAPHYGIRHVIWKRRIFVWQPPYPGLTGAMKQQTNSSALLGTVNGSHLIDLEGNDMQVSVPLSLPEHAVVYLN